MSPEVQAFYAWYRTPGTAPLEYHRGHLAMLPLRPPVASIALHMASGNDPKVLLAQKRHGPHDYSYLAWKVWR